MPEPKLRPIIDALSDREALALLRRNHVGRVSFIRDGQPDIVPVHYVMRDGWLFVRSAPGTKTAAFAHHPFVAFEVDEIDDTFAWRSVVARGTVYLLPGDGTRIERTALDRAVRALRSLVPAALTEDDPTPARQIVYGIHIDELTGRTARASRG